MITALPLPPKKKNFALQKKKDVSSCSHAGYKTLNGSESLADCVTTAVKLDCSFYIPESKQCIK